MATLSRCSELSLDGQNDPAGSSSSFSSFLLLAEHGPWSRTIADDTVTARFDADTAAWISGNPDGLRPFAIRPMSDRNNGAQRYLAGRVGAAGRLRSFDDPPSQKELLDLAGSGPLPGAPHPGPLIGVCTNGKRDLCCAVYGRPIVKQLAAAYGHDLVSEISHLGGHRFAGTLLVLPWGYSYGFLDPTAATAVVADLLDGLVHPQHLRGRADLSPAAQAADIAWRQKLGAAGPDAVRLTSEQVDGDITEVTGTVDGRAETLRLRYRSTGTIGETVCGGKPFGLGHWVVD